MTENTRGHEPDTMWLNADNCTLIIKSPYGEIYHATFEHASMMAKFTGDDMVVCFYYHEMLYDENGEPIGRSNKPTRKILKIVDAAL